MYFKCLFVCIVVSAGYRNCALWIEVIKVGGALIFVLSYYYNGFQEDHKSDESGGGGGGEG